MGLFGKSFEEKVKDAAEEVGSKYPAARISASANNKTVTLTGSAPDLATKGAIMAAFNALVDTDNTINQITIPQVSPAAGSGTFPPPMTSGSSLSTGPAASAGSTRTHQVVSGDTLSAIAKKYYGDASKYPRIFDANRDILSDPDKIQVGQTLKIPS
jgi:nucleoid-associated protein YgaU